MSDRSLCREPTEYFYSDSVDEEIPNATEQSKKPFYVIRDNFTNINDVTKSIKESGVKDCGLIFGIDYTMSNRSHGQKTFGGRSLHDTSGPEMNPYQKTICILGEALEELNDDGKIPAFGFGSTTTRDKSVFPLKAEGMCNGFNEVLDIYNQITPKVQLSGPTSFVPLIEEAVKIVKKEKKYHILVIVADGQVTDKKINQDAIVAASNWPLSIIMIGVGDGPWYTMNDFDDGLSERKFDNFQFVDYYKTVTGAQNPYAALAVEALMDIPEQYQMIKNHELLRAGGLTDDRIRHLLSNESDLNDYITNEPAETCIKALMSEASKQNNKRAMKIMLEFIVQQLKERLRDRRVRVWAGEEITGNDHRNTVLVCYYSGPCDKSMKYFYDLRIIYREYDAIDEESDKARSHELRTERDLTNKMCGLVNQAIKIHGKRLFAKHSNVEAISSGNILSSQSRGLVQEICVIIYCRLKGIIPFGEDPFPKRLNVNDKESVALDVREGFFSYQADAPDIDQAKPSHPKSKTPNTPLRMGCSVGPAGYNITGTLGPFVEMNPNRIGFLTCAHVLFGNDVDVLRNVHATIKTDQIKKEVVQPSNGDIICGRVVNAIFNGNWIDWTSKETHGILPTETGDNYDPTPTDAFGIDAAIIEITTRVPNRGEFVSIEKSQLDTAGFTQYQPPRFDTGEIMAFPIMQKFQRPVIKVGTETGLTRGLLGLTDGMVKYSSLTGNLGNNSEDQESTEIMYGLMQIYPTLYPAKQPFSVGGDSGSGIFLVGDDNKLTCIGLNIGALSDGVGIATPIDKVLTANCIKKFQQEVVEEVR